MFFILFCALTVLIVWQSMGQSQASRFSSKILLRRRTKLLRVWNDMGVSDSLKLNNLTFILGWSNPLIYINVFVLVANMHVFCCCCCCFNCP